MWSLRSNPHCHTQTITNRSLSIHHFLVHHPPTKKNENTTQLCLQPSSAVSPVVSTRLGCASAARKGHVETREYLISKGWPLYWWGIELFLRGLAGPRRIGQFDSYPWLQEASTDDGAHGTEGTQQQAHTKFIIYRYLQYKPIDILFVGGTGFGSIPTKSQMPHCMICGWTCWNYPSLKRF